MKALFIVATMTVTALAASPAHAQFGWSVTFDPTQAGHALSQIAEAEKLYTTTSQMTENVINGYNLAKHMASSPQSLYSSYGSGLPSWLPVLPTQDTYGNTGKWIGQVNQYTGETTSAIQGASIPRIAKLTGYENLDAQGQQAVAAKTATLDLADATNATNLQTVGTIRVNATQRAADIANLETASHSLDQDQQTELATLQRINQALLLMLRNQQDESQLLQSQTLTQSLQGKEQQDDMKFTFQVSQGYEDNYKSQAGPSAADGIKAALSY